VLGVFGLGWQVNIAYSDFGYNLEVITISIKVVSEITICNIYLPNQTNFNHTDLNNLINQIPKPFIITEDFNSHSPYWGSEKIDHGGKSIEKILENKHHTT
jgi:hypothetical protein